MKVLFLIAGLLFSPISWAQMYQFDYYLGKVRVSESEQTIVLQTNPPLHVEILPGGPTWPRLSLDDTGRIYAGNVVVNPATGSKVSHPTATIFLSHDLEISDARGGLIFHHAGKICYISSEQLRLDLPPHQMVRVKNPQVQFSRSASTLVALVTQFDEFGHTANYLTEQIDLVHCKVVLRQNLGNLDFLIELNNSTEGGWWITGSIEQTLLQSNDGFHWRAAGLPKNLSSLFSAYVVNAREIWLAAILTTDDESESPYLLVYSEDGGDTWRNVLANDPGLERMPVGWLEGQKRRVLP